MEVRNGTNVQSRFELLLHGEGTGLSLEHVTRIHPQVVCERTEEVGVSLKLPDLVLRHYFFSEDDPVDAFCSEESDAPEELPELEVFVDCGFFFSAAAPSGT
jgi:hypothetical protein